MNAEMCISRYREKRDDRDLPTEAGCKTYRKTVGALSCRDPTRAVRSSRGLSRILCAPARARAGQALAELRGWRGVGGHDQKIVCSTCGSSAVQGDNTGVDDAQLELEIARVFARPLVIVRDMD